MNKKNFGIIIVLAIVLVLIFVVAYGFYSKLTAKVKNPVVTMEVEGYGTIKLELYPEVAPESVANFVNLAQNGFYDGTIIHRVSKNVNVIQGGGYKLLEKENTQEETTGEDVSSTETSKVNVSPKLSDLGIKVSGAEDIKYCIKGEFIENGVENTLRHTEGVISMARADYTQSYSSDLVEESYNSATSQFFIMTGDNPALDKNYAAFGKVIEGMDVVNKIYNVELKAAESEGEEASEPAKDVIISSVKVDTQGVTYDKPNTLTPWNYVKWIYEQYGINVNTLEN